MTPLEQLHADVESACPGFFAGLDLIVTGVDLNDVANTFVDVMDTEEKCLALGAKLTAFQQRLNALTPDDVAWLQARTGDGLCVLLTARHRLQSLRREGGMITITHEQLGAGLDVSTRMGRYAHACRFLVGQLYQRAHLVEHHWNDMPVA